MPSRLSRYALHPVLASGQSTRSQPRAARPIGHNITSLYGEFVYGARTLFVNICKCRKRYARFLFRGPLDEHSQYMPSSDGRRSPCPAQQDGKDGSRRVRGRAPLYLCPSLSIRGRMALGKESCLRFVAAFLILFAVVSCSNKRQDDGVTRIAALRGPSAVAMVQWIDSLTKTDNAATEITICDEIGRAHV